MKLNLADYAPRSYRELIYDVVIQLIIGISDAHRVGLIHGNLDISKILLQFSGKEKIMECKITDFEPEASMKIPNSA